MKVIVGFPPNYDEIAKVFDLSGFNPVFTYGNKLYNPHGYTIPPDLMVHEEVHEKQQGAMGPENWWELYLKDEKFRLEQEVEAYRVQYRYAKENYERNYRKFLLKEFARHLSSKLYGNIINQELAKELISAV